MKAKERGNEMKPTEQDQKGEEVIITGLPEMFSILLPVETVFLHTTMLPDSFLRICGQILRKGKCKEGWFLKQCPHQDAASFTQMHPRKAGVKNRNGTGFF